MVQHKKTRRAPLATKLQYRVVIPQSTKCLAFYCSCLPEKPRPQDSRPRVRVERRGRDLPARLPRQGSYSLGRAASHRNTGPKSPLDKHMPQQTLPNGRKAIAKQIVLPFGKALEISYKSLKLRFFRSMITVSSLILAVSFLAFVLVSADVANGLLHHGDSLALERLQQAGYDVAQGSVGASAKERWIVILSLLVCAVGIVNAQLMSVTERFREIGVMKCLGALDRFVLRLFLLEAAMQGLAGSFLGAVLGCLVGLFFGALRFGFAALGDIILLDLAQSFLLAVFAGCALSLAGVLYPAIVASRMRPVLALRAEH